MKKKKEGEKDKRATKEATDPKATKSSGKAEEEDDDSISRSSLKNSDPGTPSSLGLSDEYPFPSTIPMIAQLIVI